MRGNTKNRARELPSQILDVLRSLPDRSKKKVDFFLRSVWPPLLFKKQLQENECFSSKRKVCKKCCVIDNTCMLAMCRSSGLAAWSTSTKPCKKRRRKRRGYVLLYSRLNVRKMVYYRQDSSILYGRNNRR